MSLDGKTSVAAQDSRQLSCAESQAHTQQIRRQVDAILVGARTVCHDNPQLTVRVAVENETPLKQPTRVILSGRNQLPLNLKVFDSQLPGKTILATINKNDKTWFKSLISEKLEVLVLPKDSKGQIHLPSLLKELAHREITSLLVEGGMTVHESFFNEKLVNKIQVYMTPVFIGSLEKKQALQFLDFFQVGQDFHFIAHSKEDANV
jgi:diaminohydroxyphosphoribosylaminopyrimidine deaminase/5-amino-6-(5-phosphoribosylamino)uracil reductase